ncbi:Serine/threonine-protein kinase [Rhynchospora pubera]|uniref:Receptor-like serine/threonine-protein kinase n=1 Tax=Rhynchospora pubera TaxID=906938 RepID=A0AAV8CPK5_9POAL|nr:Serine/threonine-protein kinase [Rhynchospora pubera]KAJ4810224.1 Serine/threonine-protein kinase [Rhynchospora pubera]
MISKQVTIALFLLAFSPSTFPADTLQIYQNITDGQTLVTPNSIFELGFFSPGSSSNRFLGIWYAFSPDTVVWVANRDSPLNNTSGTLILNKSGSLKLYDASGRIVWSPRTTSSDGINSPILQLNESGNLVLKDQTSNRIIWQSFDYPTNTMLTGMTIGKNLRTGFETYLSSWKSRDDPSEGDYTFKLDPQGAPELVVRDRSQIKSRSGMWNGLYFSWAPQTSTYTSLFNIRFVWNQDEVSYGIEMKSASTISRLVMNETGISQRFIWDQRNQKWNSIYFQTIDECSSFAECGPFGICQRDGIRACSCLKGFEPVAPDEWSIKYTSGGCKRTTPLGCSTDSDGFYKLEGVEIPYSHDAIADASISIEECRKRCLMNCSCVAYTLLDIRGEGSGCVMWNTALIDMRYVIGGQDLYLKVAKSELGISNKKKRATIGVISSSLILLLLVFLFVYLLWRKKMRYSKQDIEKRHLAQSNSLKGADLPIFNLCTILQATDNFSITNKLGEGGFGIVYKGQLLCGQEIAVKRLSMDSLQGLNEFMNEVLLITKLQHRNLVRLLGCCIDNNERMLIYEYMTNKSLDFYIFDATRRASLNWTARLEIVIGIARGLLYLHQDSRFNVIHRDLKAANVLLDEQMNPKISDFGTARLFKREQGIINTETVIGTRGYMSPEYVLEGVISVKSDVYSFGVLILEIISGKKNQGNQNLLAYAWKLWEEGNSFKLLDEAVKCSVSETELRRYVQMALLCVQESPDDRPSMSAFFTMLSSDTLLQDPKKPLVGTRIRSFPSDWSLYQQSYEHDSTTGDQLTITGIEGR